MAMEDSSMMSPADIAALTRGNTGFGGDGISWLVLILLLFAELQKGQLEQTIAAQAQRINQLELAQQMCGVVRYPMTYACSVCRWPCDGNSVSGRSSRIWCNTNCDCRRS